MRTTRLELPFVPVALLLLLGWSGGCGPVGGETQNNTSCTTASCTTHCNSLGYDGIHSCEQGSCVCNGAPSPDAGWPGSDGGSPPDGRCDIDLLVVMDTSGSMYDAARNFREVAFGSFVEQLNAYPGLGNYRIAVTNHLYGSNPAGNLTVDDSLFLTAGWDPDYQCQNLVDGCDDEGHEYELLGGSAMYYLCDDVPEMAHLRDCGFASGQSWMQGPSSTLLDELLCVGNIACHQAASLDEPTLRAGVEALTYGANAGFLRTDGLLVVMYITDEDDASTGMSQQQMRDQILALKGGDERYVVVVTLGGPRVGTVELNLLGEMGCVSTDYGAVKESPNLIDFSDLFGERGLHFNLCEDDISSALTTALDRLEVSCDEIIVL